MKPLTIEQLKALEVGDWVWVEHGIHKLYCKIYNNTRDLLGIGGNTYLDYSDYGTKWLAYKNKEQAEAKGEIVELPCKVGDTVCAIMEIDYKYKIVEFTANKIIVDECGNFYFDTPTSYSHRLKFGHSVFADKSEAERRLAELTKE